MAKKIVILNGSPREHGNTSALIRAFTKGAEEAGHTVTHFFLRGMDIRPCLGCLHGAKHTDKPCAQRDDMDKIYPAYEEADVVVLASPMYYWSITGILKIAFDRLFAVIEARNANPPKDCILLMPAEGDTEQNNKPVLDYYNMLMQELSWRDAGTIIAGGNLHIGDIKDKPALKEAFVLGKSL